MLYRVVIRSRYPCQTGGYQNDGEATFISPIVLRYYWIQMDHLGYYLCISRYLALPGRSLGRARKQFVTGYPDAGFPPPDCLLQ